jgi:hypothetical protein
LLLFTIFGQLILKDFPSLPAAGDLGSPVMNGLNRHRVIRLFGFMLALLFSAMSVKANPISPGEEPLAFVVCIPITLAILLEAICVWLLLRRWRKPPLFILWLVGMHLLTYPLSLGLLWLLYGSQPVFAVMLGEATIVLVEGGLIYLLCRFISSRQSLLPVPTISRSLFASLIGNICSAATYPLLLWLFGLILSAVMPADLD